MTPKAIEARRAYQREWRRKNKEHIAEYQRAWRMKNPDKWAACQNTYWERKAEKAEAVLREGKAIATGSEGE